MELDARLRTIGFCIEWVRWGVLTRKRFDEIYALYERDLNAYQEYEQEDPENHPDDDTNEPFPPDCPAIINAAIWEWIESVHPLDDVNFARALWLDERSGIGSLHVSLLADPTLNNAQFEYLFQLCLARGQSHLAERERVIRRLRAEGLTDDVFEEILTHCPGPVQQSLFWRDDVQSNRRIVETLAQRGATKAVRSSARQMLNSRRFRDSE